MSWLEDNDFDGYEPIERTGFVQVLVGDKVKSIEYCLNCGSINIKTSKAGNNYCADLCWVKQELADEQ